MEWQAGHQNYVSKKEGKRDKQEEEKKKMKKREKYKQKKHMAVGYRTQGGIPATLLSKYTVV